MEGEEGVVRASAPHPHAVEGGVEMGRGGAHYIPPSGQGRGAWGGYERQEEDAEENVRIAGE